MYAVAAQYNWPPQYPVTMICNAIDQASYGNNIIDKIYSGVVAVYGNDTCLIDPSTYISEIEEGWGWQVISNLICEYNRYILLKQLNLMNFFL
jgi:lysosomal Pro-X carboxypeptidase